MPCTPALSSTARYSRPDVRASPLTARRRPQAQSTHDPLLALLHDWSPPAADAPACLPHAGGPASDAARLPAPAGDEAGAPMLAIKAVSVHEARRDPRAAGAAATTDELRRAALRATVLKRD